MTSAANQPTVVVGIDGSDSALGGAQWAADFAAGGGFALTLLHAHLLGSNAHGELLAEAQEAVRSKHPDLEIRTEAVKGAVAAALADAAHSARLLVVGAGAQDHRALGGHAVRLAHRAACPVVVWRRPAATRTGKPLPVVVGVEESDEPTGALTEAFAIAATLHAPLTVVHMWDIGAAVGMGDLGGQGNMDWELLEVLQSRQRQRMDELIEPLAHQYRNVRISKEFQDISPAKGLVDLSATAQLVVVGSHGRGGVVDTILGTVSQTVIHHAECPVLVVR